MHVYVVVYILVSLSSTLESIQAIHSHLLQVVNRLDAIDHESRITAIVH